MVFCNVDLMFSAVQDPKIGLNLERSTCQANRFQSYVPETAFCINSETIERFLFNPLTPNDHYSGRTAPRTSKRCILYIYSTNKGTEYFKHYIYSPFFSLQNAVCFVILTYLVHVLFTFPIQVC